MLTAQIDSKLLPNFDYSRHATARPQEHRTSLSAKELGHVVRLREHNEVNQTLSTSGRSGEVLQRFTDPGTDIEYENLLAQQSRLAQKKVTNTISKRESLELQLIRWAVDRIELARAEQDIDRLTALVTVHERLAQEVHSIVGALKGK